MASLRVILRAEGVQEAEQHLEMIKELQTRSLRTHTPITAYSGVWFSIGYLEGFFKSLKTAERVKDYE